MNFQKVHPIFKILLAIVIVVGIACFAAHVFVENRAKTNIVRYSRPSSGIAIQFELPEGYGAVENPEGEGTYQMSYLIGKFVPESGPHVLQASLSVADSIRIIPSYDSKVVTLEDWRATGSVDDETDALNVQSLEIAGVPASVSTFGGMGVTKIIQFVKDKNYYEIRTGGALEDEAIAKIIDTFTFIK